MSGVINVERLEQLRQFLNEKGVMEIVVRGDKKRIKAFQKVAIADLPNSEEVEKAINVLKENIKLNEKNLKALGQIAKLEHLGLLMNGANLCATCAGFAVIYAKLNSISEEIQQRIAHVEATVKKGHDVHVKFEFTKILAVHTDMLDSRRRLKPYSEEKMRELVDGEYAVLVMLIDTFLKDISEDHEALIFSIFSLLSMFTVSLRFFDEIYYANNHETLSDTDKWHPSHVNWMSVYATMTSRAFIEKLQDHAMFETKLSPHEADLYCAELLEQVRSLRQDVTDNQELIMALGDIALLHEVQTAGLQRVRDTIMRAVESSPEAMESPEIRDAFERALEFAVAV